MDDGDTTTSPPRLSAHDDDTVDRCSDENRPAALLKLGLRSDCAYASTAAACWAGNAGNDSRFFAPADAPNPNPKPPPPPPPEDSRSRSGVAGRCRGALCDRTRALADSVAAM